MFEHISTHKLNEYLGELIGNYRRAQGIFYSEGLVLASDRLFASMQMEELKTRLRVDVRVCRNKNIGCENLSEAAKIAEI